MGDMQKFKGEKTLLILDEAVTFFFKMAGDFTRYLIDIQITREEQDMAFYASAQIKSTYNTSPDNMDMDVYRMSKLNSMDQTKLTISSGGANEFLKGIQSNEQAIDDQ